MRATFISLPTSDVAAAAAFFGALGFELDPQVSDERTARVLIGDGSSVMLCATPWFSQFTGVPATDPTRAAEVSIGVAVTRAEVDELTERAVAAGGTDAGTQDLGYLYMRAFRDLDGHRWSFMAFAG